YHRVTAHTARGGPQRALSLDQVGPGDAIAVDPALLSEVDESIDRGHPGRDVRAPTSPEPDDDLGEGVAETRQGLVDARELPPQRQRHPQIERSPRSRWRQPARRHGASRRRSGTVGAKVTPRLAGPRGGRHICPSW